MPRPRKCRRVCHFPPALRFAPAGQEAPGEEIVLTVDEYETLRLMDREGLSQEECGQRMGVARTTVQQIYNSARKKLSAALVDGVPFKIQGGDYQLCDGQEHACGCGGCRRHRRCQAGENREEEQSCGSPSP